VTRSDARRLLLTKTLAEAHALADSALSRVRASKRRKGEREPRSKGPTKADRKAAKREETAALRSRLIALTDEMCERCGFHADPATGHMHHTEGGSGRRLAHQSIANVAWLCFLCHGIVHRNPSIARDLRQYIAVKRAASEETP
jgi:predicted HNH restriction endonuclease